MFADRTARGFTLIEMLIVVALLGVFAAVATDTFTNVMRAQNKTRIVNELEQSGNYALSVMEQQIRDAEKITCCGGEFTNPGDCKGINAGEGVGLLVGGETVCFCIWNVAGDVRAILRSVGAEDCYEGCLSGNNTPYSYLTDTDPVKGVSIGDESSFSCDREGTRVKIQLELLPPPGSPARQDFRAGEGVTLETTVKLRGKL